MDWPAGASDSPLWPQHCVPFAGVYRAVQKTSHDSHMLRLCWSSVQVAWQCFIMRGGLLVGRQNSAVVLSQCGFLTGCFVWV
jgi:hypothetical protein